MLVDAGSHTLVAGILFDRHTILYQQAGAPPTELLDPIHRHALQPLPAGVPREGLVQPPLDPLWVDVIRRGIEREAEDCGDWAGLIAHWSSTPPMSAPLLSR